MGVNIDESVFLAWVNGTPEAEIASEMRIAVEDVKRIIARWRKIGWAPPAQDAEEGKSG